MREILFRGRRLDGGEWVYGYYVGPAGVTDDHEICDANDITGCRYDVDPSTVGQYTGLIDKNGVKIFEGDIIRGEGSKAKTDNFVIRWSEPCCGFSAGEEKRTWPNLNQATINGYEVIGNINDNPELLEEKT